MTFFHLYDRLVLPFPSFVWIQLMLLHRGVHSSSMIQHIGWTDDEIEKLLSLAILSPTSFNLQNWRFVAVTDVEQKKKLREAAMNQEHVEYASLVLVLCADLQAWDDHPERYWNNAPQQVQDLLVPMIRGFYEGNDQLQRDEALRSIGIVAQTIMIVAKDMGYDSCPMIGFNPDAVADIIRLPEHHMIGMMIVVGKATEQARQRSGQLPLSDLMVRDHF